MDANSEQFDVVLTFDIKIFEIVVEDVIFRRRNTKSSPIAVLNISVKDNAKEAAKAAPLALNLC